MTTPKTTEAAPAPAEPSVVPEMSTTAQNSAPNRMRPEKETKRNGFDSIQDVIFQSIEETQKMKDGGQLPESNVFVDTMKDITTVANSTIKSIQQWANRNGMEPEGDESSAQRSNGPGTMTKSQQQLLIKDLAWPLIICGFSSNSSKTQPLNPPFANMRETAHDIWKFANGTNFDDDEQTLGTVDTIQEENNQIRRLGSWGTINTSSASIDTDLNSLDENDAIDRIEDDDGNVIDPLLLKKAQATRGKRSQRREKVVRFDYPPIKSLRQCPRPDPEDLPNLFFTEGELDQIEDDRYSTMSTDDIEIVAVSSKLEEPTSSKFSQYKSPRAKDGLHTGLSDSPKREGPEIEDEIEENTSWKQTRRRNPSPYRRHHEDDEDADFPTHESKSPSNSGRLVKGVQIYLRERSTGT